VPALFSHSSVRPQGHSTAQSGRKKGNPL
jgi:hypothetical protein